MAAPWIEHFSLSEIARAIQTDRDFLVAHQQPTSQRHASMRQVFDYSWQLLTEPQMRLLAQLSIFRGLFDRAAALTIGGATLPTLIALTDKSLLRVEGSGKYGLHSLLREFSAEKLPADTRPLESAYATYFAERIANTIPTTFHKDNHHIFAAIQSQIPDISAAWSWSLRHGDQALIAQFVQPLYVLMRHIARLEEGRLLYQEAADRLAERWPDENRTRATTILAARIRSRLAFFQLFCGYLDEARAHGEFALAVFIQFAVQGERNLPTVLLQDVYSQLGRHDEHLRIAQNALALTDEQSSDTERAMHMGNVGRGLDYLGRFEEARPYHARAVRIARKLQDDYRLSMALANFGRNALDLGYLEEAKQCLNESLAIRQRFGNSHRIASVLRTLGRLALLNHDYTQAHALFSEALERFTATGRHGKIAKTYLGLARVALAQVDYAQAHAHFQSALTYADRYDSISNGLDILSGWADYLYATGEQQRALTIKLYVANHPNAFGITRSQARTFLNAHGEPVNMTNHQINGRELDLSEAISVFTLSSR